MDGRCVLLTGFGAFEEVSDNPSGALARELDGLRLGAGRLVGAVLPVSFRRAPPALDELVERVRPDAIIATGVHRGDGFRIERGAGVALTPGRPDADGVDACELEPRGGEPLETDFDLARLAAILARASGSEVVLSPDAGRYVCECTYRRVLEIASERGARGLFVHLPAPDKLPLDRQSEGLRALLEEVFRQIGPPA